MADTQNIRFGLSTMAYPSQDLGELRDSNDLLGDREALQARMAEDGYLLLHGLIDREKVLAARRRILTYMAEHEGLEPGSRPLDGVMGQYGKSVGLLGRKAITHDPQVLDVLEGEALSDFYRDYFGEPVRTFDYKWLRAVGQEEFTGCHYDVVYMGQGSSRLHTCWVPFGDIPVHQGTLAICVGSHNLDSFERLRQTYGKIDVDRDYIREGSFTQDPLEITSKFGGQWKTTSFQAGDILTFGMYTMHASTTNTTDLWRLSCDVRFQPKSDPADPRWVGDEPQGHPVYLEQKPDKVTIEAARAEWGL